MKPLKRLRFILDSLYVTQNNTNHILCLEDLHKITDADAKVRESSVDDETKRKILTSNGYRKGRKGTYIYSRARIEIIT